MKGKITDAEFPDFISENCNTPKDGLSELIEWLEIEIKNLNAYDFTKQGYFEDILDKAKQIQNNENN